jgi:hypothetical protein
MTQYVVVHAFQDKYTKQYYGVGSIYEATDENRAFDLENGGYIVPDNTEAANVAKANATGNAQNSEEIKQVHAQIRQDAEPKTMVNGKIVSLSDAKMAQQALEAKTNQKTGIQEHHDNSTEAVQAGQVAKNQQQAQAQVKAQQQMQQTKQQATVANVQSGQQALEKEIQDAKLQAQYNNPQANDSQAMQGESMGAYTSQQYNQESSAQSQSQSANANAEETKTKARAKAQTKGNQ